MFQRVIENQVCHHLERGKSILLLGPRQTGKTTLIKGLKHHRYLNLMDSELRRLYEQSPSVLSNEVRALAPQVDEIPVVIIDEVQRCPSLMDEIQILIDEKIAQFIITGSSARKLRRQSHVNLLPGRVVSLSITSLLPSEYEQEISMQDLLVNGTLPGILNESEQADKDEDLRTYASVYLEEEVRAESLVRDLAPFSHFLQIAASESGSLCNYAGISKQVGVSAATIKEYFQILEDCLVAFRVEPLILSGTRRRLVKSPKYLMFDLGVRRACAREAAPLPITMNGQLFEQWIGLLIRNWQQYFSPQQRLYFWRDSNGPEVDWVVEANGELLPIEVKWTNKPTDKDARHLKTFMADYSNSKAGIIVCQASHRQLLSDGVLALPWQELVDYLANEFS